MNFKEWLKNRRGELHLTQQATAAILGTSQATFVRWENGSKIPTFAEQRGIREILNEITPAPSAK